MSGEDYRSKVRSNPSILQSGQKRKSFALLYAAQLGKHHYYWAYDLCLAMICALLFPVCNIIMLPIMLSCACTRVFEQKKKKKGRRKQVCFCCCSCRQGTHQKKSHCRQKQGKLLVCKPAWSKTKKLRYVDLWRAVADMLEARIWRVPDIAHFNWADLPLSWNVKTPKTWYKAEG